MIMKQCSFCEATVRHIGEKEVEAGWGKVEAQIGTEKIVLIHCPEHFEEFKKTIIEWGKEHGDGSTRRRQ